jgi:hypothetical protein
MSTADDCECGGTGCRACDWDPHIGKPDHPESVAFVKATPDHPTWYLQNAVRVEVEEDGRLGLIQVDEAECRKTVAESPDLTARVIAHMALEIERLRRANKVVPLRVKTLQPIPADDVLSGALGKLDYVLVLGWEKETEKLWSATSDSDMGEALYVIGLFQHKLFRGDFG